MEMIGERKSFNNICDIGPIVLNNQNESVDKIEGFFHSYVFYTFHNYQTTFE